MAPEVEDQPLAAELRTSPETGNEQPEEYVSVYRRNANDPYARRCKIFSPFSKSTRKAMIKVEIAKDMHLQM